jgi:hypothetical protein
MDPRVVADFFLMGVGSVVVIGTLVLVYLGKVQLDASGKVVLKVPIFGQLTTSVPALALFLVGLTCLLWASVDLSKTSPTFTVTGNLNPGNKHVMVYVAAASTLLNGSKTSYELRVPFTTSQTQYEVLFIDVPGDVLISQQSVPVASPYKMSSVSKSIILQ